MQDTTYSATVSLVGEFNTLPVMTVNVHLMQSITSAKIIEKLRIIFANHGIPRKVVTDNGSTFMSYEFQEFMQKNRILHVKSAPYHPSSNSLAERAVQTLKRGIA